VPCAICGAPEPRPVRQKFGLPIGRCRECGLVFAAPRLPRSDVLARYSAEYFWREYLPSLGVTDPADVDLAMLDARYAALLGRVAELCAPPGRLLEIGCGAGLLLKAAERAGWSVSGFDASETAAAFGRERLRLDVACVLAEDADLGRRRYDVVVMCEVLEHLFEPGRVLSAVRLALRDGGLLVLSTPNTRALSGWALGASWAVWSPAEHLYYFDERTLTRLLEATGFGRVVFDRGPALRRTFAAMNPDYTHDGSTLRARVYKAAVRRTGRAAGRLVVAAGLGDTLLCFSRAA
jgi:SAM-dependent methyltransferase